MAWAMSVWNASTMTYVIDPRDCEAHESRDDAKRELQAWLLSEADSTVDDENSAAMLDDASQQLNYAEFAQLGGVFDWTVETVHMD
jgi:hypothetical protein